LDDVAFAKQFLAEFVEPLNFAPAAVRFSSACLRMRADNWLP